MNPLTYVGVPDWRSAALALAFAIPWLVLLAGKWLRNLWLWLWVVFAVGAILFPLSIAWVQVPVQQTINNLYLKIAPAEMVQRYVLAAGLPVVVVAGLVQEVAKFTDALAGLHLVRARHSARAGLAVGAAAGAGYGAAEAFWIFNGIFASGFTWATVQLGGVAALLGFVERFFAVMFHASVVALMGYGVAIAHPWRYLLLAIGLHALLDYAVVLLQARVLGVAGVEAIVALLALATLAAALWLRGRTRFANGQPNSA